MLALTTPFEVYTVKRLKERVWSSTEKRPLVSESWSGNIKLLLKRGWANDVSTRFSMAQVEGILKKECIRVRDGNSDGLEHQRRRSTFVFRGSKTNARNSATRRASIQKALAAAAAGTDTTADSLIAVQSEHDPRVMTQYNSCDV